MNEIFLCRLSANEYCVVLCWGGLKRHFVPIALKIVGYLPAYPLARAVISKIGDASSNMEIYMARALAGLVAVSSCLTFCVAANCAEQPAISKIIANPKSYLGKQIDIKAVSCVDDVKAGFLCIIKKSGHTLRVEAGALGMSGGDEVGEKLIGPCKGKDKLGSAKCRFDIQIEPRSVQDEATMLELEGEKVTRLYSGTVEMRVSKSK